MMTSLDRSFISVCFKRIWNFFQCFIFTPCKKKNQSCYLCSEFSVRMLIAYNILNSTVQVIISLELSFHLSIKYHTSIKLSFHAQGFFSLMVIEGYGSKPVTCIDVDRNLTCSKESSQTIYYCLSITQWLNDILIKLIYWWFCWVL